MYKIRFTVNQVGLQLEQFINGEWSGASVIYKPENHGGIQALKSKILYAIPDNCQVMPAGEYRENGITVTCV